MSKPSFNELKTKFLAAVQRLDLNELKEVLEEAGDQKVQLLNSKSENSEDAYSLALLSYESYEGADNSSIKKIVDELFKRGLKPGANADKDLFESIHATEVLEYIKKRDEFQKNRKHNNGNRLKHEEDQVEAAFGFLDHLLVEPTEQPKKVLVDTIGLMEKISTQDKNVRKQHQEINSKLNAMDGFSFDDSTYPNMLELAQKLTDKTIPDSPLKKALLKLPKFSDVKKTQSDVIERFEICYKKSYAAKETGVYEVDNIKRKTAWLRFISQEIAEQTAAGLLDENQGISLDEWLNITQNLLGDTGTNISISKIVGQRLPKGTVAQYGALAGGLRDAISAEEFLKVKSLLSESTLNEVERENLKSVMIGADNVLINIDGTYKFLKEPEDKKTIEAHTVVRESMEELMEWLLAQTIADKISLVELVEKALGGEKLSTEAAGVFSQQQKILEENEGTFRRIIELKKELDKVRASNLNELESKKKEHQAALAKLDASSAEYQKLEAEQKAAMEQIEEEHKKKLDKAQDDYKDTRETYRQKVYKAKIEPLFARFLKTNGDGSDIFNTVLTSMKNSVSGCEVNDLTYPGGRIAQFKKFNKEGDKDEYYKTRKTELEKDKARLENPRKPEGRVTIFVPKSSSYFVEIPQDTRLAKFISYVANLSKTRPELREYCVECRGFEENETSLQHAESLLKLFSQAKFNYPHEGFTQIQAALNEVREICSSVEISTMLRNVKQHWKSNNVIETEFKNLPEHHPLKGKEINFENAFQLQLEKLVGFTIKDSAQPEKELPHSYAVAVALLGDAALVKELLPNLTPAKEFSQNVRKAISEVVSLRDSKTDYKKPKEILSFFGCKNLNEYLDFIRQKAATPDQDLELGKIIHNSEGKVGFNKSGKSLEKVDAVAIQAAVDQALSSKPEKEKKKILKDKVFFHHFILKLNELEASNQAGSEVVSRDAISKLSALDAPLQESVDQSYLANDVAISQFGTAISETRGHRKSQEDSFTTGLVKFGSKDAIRMLTKEAAKIRKKVSKEESGSTVAMVHVGEDKVVTALNIGDTRVVAYIKGADGKVRTKRLTKDHELSNPLEVAIAVSSLKSQNAVNQNGINFYSDVHNEVRILNNKSSSLNMSRSLGDNGYGVSSEFDCYQYDLSKILKPGDVAYVVSSCDGMYERVSEDSYNASLEKWFSDENLRNKFSNNMAVYLEDCAILSGSTDNITIAVNTVGQQGNHLTVIADGHGGKKVSSAVVDHIASNLIDKKSRIVHRATDLGLLGYKDAKIATQVVNKTRAKIPPKNHEILGISEDASPKDIINSYIKLSDEIQRQNEAKRIPALKSICSAFLEQFVESSKRHSSHAVLNIYTLHELQQIVNGAKDKSGKSEKTAALASFIIESASAAVDSWKHNDAQLEKSEKSMFGKVPEGEEQSVVSAILKYRAPFYDDSGMAHNETGYVDPNKVIHGGNPLVCYVSRYGNHEQLKTFLDGLKGEAKDFFDINAVDAKGKNALYYAVENLEVDKAVELLRKRANPDFKYQIDGRNCKISDLLIVKNTNDKKVQQILDALMQYGLDHDHNFRSQMMAKGYNFENANNYDLYGVAEADVAQVVISQIMERSGNSAIIGVSEIPNQGGIINYKVPHKVADSYEKVMNIISIGRDNSEAKEKLSKSFLVGYRDGNQESLFPFVNEPKLVNMLNNYTRFMELLNQAHRFVPAEGTKEIATNQMEILDRNFSKMINFDNQTYHTSDFESVLSNVREIHSKFSSYDVLSSHRAYFKAFANIDFTASSKISASDYLWIMQNVPEEKEFEVARKNLADAFVAQFSDKLEAATNSRGIKDVQTKEKEIAAIASEISGVEADQLKILFNSLRFSTGNNSELLSAVELAVASKAGREFTVSQKVNDPSEFDKETKKGTENLVDRSIDLSANRYSKDKKALEGMDLVNEILSRAHYDPQSGNNIPTFVALKSKDRVNVLELDGKDKRGVMGAQVPLYVSQKYASLIAKLPELERANSKSERNIKIRLAQTALAAAFIKQFNKAVKDYGAENLFAEKSMSDMVAEFNSITKNLKSASDEMLARHQTAMKTEADNNIKIVQQSFEKSFAKLKDQSLSEFMLIYPEVPYAPIEHFSVISPNKFVNEKGAQYLKTAISSASAYEGGRKMIGTLSKIYFVLDSEKSPKEAYDEVMKRKDGLSSVNLSDAEKNTIDQNYFDNLIKYFSPLSKSPSEEEKKSHAAKVRFVEELSNNVDQSGLAQVLLANLKSTKQVRLSGGVTVSQLVNPNSNQITV